ncbi:MAG TPA: TonB-dependent receptor, partial [Methylophilaceae bacterium]
MLQSKLKPLALSLALLGITTLHTQAYAENKAEALEAGTVDVVSTTPLPSIGTPINQVPSNVQTASDKSIAEQRSLDIGEYMNNNMGSVTTNDTVGNPYQSDVSYRGFTASPLLGTPQGLSVFLDGVRVNEPFGDIVNWDLIPVSAIANINLIPGSNPLFGLNTLGGALSVHTKSGAEYPGSSITLTGGSWGRAAAEFETGGKIENLDYFFTGNIFHEDGWRDHSPSDVRQLFGKVGWQDDKNDIDLSVMLADNDMDGTQALPQAMLNTPRTAFTWPDSISNKMEMITLKGSHYFNDVTLASAETYYRHNKADGFNSNVNDNFDNTLPTDPTNPTASNAISSTDTDGFGGSAQLTLLNDLMSHKNQFTGGLGADFGRTNFSSDTLTATVVGSQTVTLQPITDAQMVRLKADSDNYSLYATDTFSITDKFLMTASARYNITYVSLNGDSLDITDPTLVPGDLNGDHTYSRLNPALGFNYNPSESLGFYVGYNEGTRAP